MKYNYYHETTLVKDFLTQYAPSFCWCSVNDLMLMAQIVFPKLRKDRLKRILDHMSTAGLFAVRASAQTGFVPVWLFIGHREPSRRSNLQRTQAIAVTA